MDLDSLDIIERPKILDVIADTIDKEIGSGILSSDGDLVAVALALPDRCAWRVTENIANILKRLVIKLFAGDNRNGLGRIDKRRGGFQARAADRDIAFFFARNDNFLIISEAFVDGFLGRCLYRTSGDRNQAGRRKHAKRAAGINVHGRASLYDNYSQ